MRVAALREAKGVSREFLTRSDQAPEDRVMTCCDTGTVERTGEPGLVLNPAAANRIRCNLDLKAAQVTVNLARDMFLIQRPHPSAKVEICPASTECRRRERDPPERSLDV